MQQVAPAQHSAPTRPDTVILLGGKGGFASRYRALAEEHGFTLEHFEVRIPPSARLNGARVALVLVIVSMISHNLRDQARKLAGSGTTVVYVNRASLSAVRTSLQQARAAHPAQPSSATRRAA